MLYNCCRIVQGDFLKENPMLGIFQQNGRNPLEYDIVDIHNVGLYF
jgi:hypothetical protein